MKHLGKKRAERGDMLLVGIGVALVLILLVAFLFLNTGHVQTMPAQPVPNPPQAVAPVQIQPVDEADDANAPAVEPAEEPNQ